MKIKFILSLILLVGVAACSTGNSSKNNELTLVFYKDSLAVYRGALDKNTQVTRCSFDTNTVVNLIRKDIPNYKSQSVLIVKPSPASDGNVSDHLNLIKSISNSLNITDSITFSLTDYEKKYFQSDERNNY